MNNACRIREIIREIEFLENEIKAGEHAWTESADEFAMAGCDPSDQYIKGQEIDSLKVELKALVAAIVD